MCIQESLIQRFTGERIEPAFLTALKLKAYIIKNY